MRLVDNVDCGIEEDESPDLVRYLGGYQPGDEAALALAHEEQPARVDEGLTANLRDDREQVLLLGDDRHVPRVPVAP